jgi:hypothetical protein
VLSGRCVRYVALVWQLLAVDCKAATTCSRDPLTCAGSTVDQKLCCTFTTPVTLQSARLIGCCCAGTAGAVAGDLPGHLPTSGVLLQPAYYANPVTAAVASVAVNPV